MSRKKPSLKKVQQKKDIRKKKPSKKTEDKKRFLVVANWKMNPVALQEVRNNFNKIKDNIRTIRETDIVISPPAVYLDLLSGLYRGKKITLGAQTVHPEKSGAFTGEIAAEQVKSVGAKYVIVGHSERREMGESDEDVRARINAVIAAEMTPIVCVGEKARDKNGKYLTVIKEQLQALFYGASRDSLEKLIIAYEPIWAIGKDSKGAVTMHALHETSIYIRKILAEMFDKRTALNATILYGGSVDSSNAAELIDGTQTDGFLVGRASLDPDEFLKIIEAVEAYARKRTP